MRVLVLSYGHGLLPFAYRLRLEGAAVGTRVWRPGFEAAWEGQFDILPDDPDQLASRVAAAERDELVVLSNVSEAQLPFRNAKRLFGVLEPAPPPPVGAVRLGGWFDGERWWAPHLLVLDLGVWPGGFGPTEPPGGLTLLRPTFPELLSQHPLLAEVWGRAAEPLKAAGFRGLAQLGLQIDDVGVGLGGMTGGWPFLHSHAFLAEVGPSLGEVLEGAPPSLGAGVVCVAPVSLAPWPAGGPTAPAGLPIEGLTPAEMGRVWWHAVQLDPEVRGLRTAGLDGLVGVVRGTGHTLGLARRRALDLLARISLPEKQVRPDAFGQVEAVLGVLEELAAVRLA